MAAPRLNSDTCQGPAMPTEHRGDYIESFGQLTIGAGPTQFPVIGLSYYRLVPLSTNADPVTIGASEATAAEGFELQSGADTGWVPGQQLSDRWAAGTLGDKVSYWTLTRADD